MEGSFFGEYNIMFGLDSNIHYQAISKCSEPIILLRIDSEKLMNIVCTDYTTFFHLHKISLQKFRFMKRVMREFSGQKHSQMIYLSDIINFMGNIYGKKNEQIANFYEEFET